MITVRQLILMLSDLDPDAEVSFRMESEDGLRKVWSSGPVVVCEEKKAVVRVRIPDARPAQPWKTHR